MTRGSSPKRNDSSDSDTSEIDLALFKEHTKKFKKRGKTEVTQ